MVLDEQENFIREINEKNKKRRPQQTRQMIRKDINEVIESGFLLIPVMVEASEGGVGN